MRRPRTATDRKVSALRARLRISPLVQRPADLLVRHSRFLNALSAPESQYNQVRTMPPTLENLAYGHSRTAIQLRRAQQPPAPKRLTMLRILFSSNSHKQGITLGAKRRAFGASDGGPQARSELERPAMDQMAELRLIQGLAPYPERSAPVRQRRAGRQ